MELEPQNQDAPSDEKPKTFGRAIMIRVTRSIIVYGEGAFDEFCALHLPDVNNEAHQALDLGVPLMVQKTYPKYGEMRTVVEVIDTRRMEVFREPIG